MDNLTFLLKNFSFVLISLVYARGAHEEESMHLHDFESFDNKKKIRYIKTESHTHKIEAFKSGNKKEIRFFHATMSLL